MSRCPSHIEYGGHPEFCIRQQGHPGMHQGRWFPSTGNKRLRLRWQVQEKEVEA